MTTPKRLFLSLLLAAVMALGLFLTWKAALGYSQHFGSYHDDGIYTVCAKAVAAGAGYRIISLPMEPLQTKYPPLFPLALSLAFLIEPRFPDNIGLIESLCCFAGIGLALGSAALMVWTGRATSLMAATILGATLMNLNFVSYLPVPMADLPCAAMSIFGLWLCEHTERRRGRLSGAGRFLLASWLMVGMALSAATLIHVMGCFAVAAAAIYLLQRRSLMALSTVLSVWALLVVPSWIWAGLHSATSPPVLVYYTNYLLAAGGTVKQGGVAVFVARNLATAFTETMDLTIQALKTLVGPETPAPLIATIYGAAWAALFAGVGRELLFARKSNIFAIWLLIHSSAHLLWPRGVGLRRLLAVLPFVYLYLFRGGRLAGFSLKRLIRIIPDGVRRRQARLALARTGCACALAFAGLLIAGNAREAVLWAGSYAYHVPPPPHAGPSYSESTEFAEAYRWLRENTATDAVLVWNNDPAAYLFTGRKAILASVGESFGVTVGADARITASDLLQSIRLARGDYLIIDPVSVGGLAGFYQLGTAVESLMQEHPGLLGSRPEFTSRYGLVTIFKINQSAGGSASVPDSSSR